jgi:hypothetical protein
MLFEKTNLVCRQCAANVDHQESEAKPDETSFLARRSVLAYSRFMCRNIRVLHHFEPPTTEEEIHDAALQYVRKVSGIQAPAKADQVAFAQAVEAIALTTKKLLETLGARGEPRTREGERAKAKEKWEKREARIRG